MEIIKKQKVKGYILLESLIALALLSIITGLVLGEVNRNRQVMTESHHRQEILNLANMAVQTGQDELHLNGISVRVVRKDGTIHVYEGQTLLLRVSKN